MSSTFTDASGATYTPSIVNTLTWQYSPQTIVHNVLNDALGNSKVTNIGQGVMTGHLSVVFEAGSDADDFATAACLGVEFTDPDHYLSATVLVASNQVTVTQDSNTLSAFVVEFDWVSLS